MQARVWYGRIRRGLVGAGALVVLGLSACATQTASSSPRTIVIYSGEDPTFMIMTIYQVDIVYPWEELELVADTAKVSVQGRSADARTPYMIYAHLHLMKRMGRLDEWLPGAQELEGFELERAILSRVSDVWLYGRTTFDAAPHLPLEELIYATESGYLDAFILTSRPDEFPEALARWREERPEEQAAYIAWFQETFQDQPPGLRPERSTVVADSASAAADTTGAARR
jgi:hypothetical protein